MFALKNFTLAAMLFIAPCVAETLPIVTITTATGGGVRVWTTTLLGPGSTEISISNTLNRTTGVPGQQAIFPDELFGEIGPPRYPEGRLSTGGTVALCCGVPIIYYYTPPLIPFETNPSVTFDAVLRGSIPACLLLGPETNPCSDHPVFVAYVLVDIPGRITLNYVGPSQGIDQLVSGTFTPLPEPATWAAAASALALLLLTKRRGILRGVRPARY